MTKLNNEPDYLVRVIGQAGLPDRVNSSKISLPIQLGFQHLGVPDLRLSAPGSGAVT